MSKKPLFELRKMSCSYSEDAADKVLYIDSLDIPKGEVVFLLGASGSGKSTLLEALGLMNDTIRNGEVRFYAEAQQQPIAMEQLWGTGQEQQLSAVRRKHLSFIFQETNLMENFTAYENICLSQMIKRGVPYSEVIPDAKALMEKVHLPETEVQESSLAVNLSGGQRQRVAFVRSLNSEFSVLFGDEPTGNLDEKNANELMHLIREQLGTERSAIIVSHDVDLAMTHADRIIAITKSGSYGVVKPQHVFTRDQWADLSAKETLSFRSAMAALYQLDYKSRKTGAAEAESASVSTASTYASLFRLKEGRALMGKRLQNLLILSAMLFLTFLSIGFANGSLSYLKEKMDNPFVNWLTITIPYIRASDTPKILERLNDPEEKSAYDYNNVSAFVVSPLRFQTKEGGEFALAKGRSFDLERTVQNSLLTDILDPANVLKGDTSGFQGPLDFGIVVHDRFLRKLGYTEYPDFLYIGRLSSDPDVLYDPLPVPIKSVVREIPGKNALAFTSCFLNAFSNPASRAFEVSRKRELRYFVATSEGSTSRAAFETALEEWIANSSLAANFDPDFLIQDSDYYLSPGFTCSFTFSSAPNPEAINRFSSAFLSEGLPEAFRAHTTRYYSYAEDSPRDCQMDRLADQISINFNSLDNVRAFSEHLLTDYNQPDDSQILEVDTGKVKEKENFNFLSKVTRIISYLLVAFGVVAISLFLSNVLKMHFNKIKMNIGTFKAFGLPDQKAIWIYFLIVLRFIGISLLISFALMLGIGYGIDHLLTNKVNVEQGVSYFKPLHQNTWLTVGVLAATALGVSYYTIYQMISRSPGDLIYNRE